MSFSVYTAVFLCGLYLLYLVIPARVRPYLLMAASALYCRHLHEMAWFGLTVMTVFVYFTGLLVDLIRVRAAGKAAPAGAGIGQAGESPAAGNRQAGKAPAAVKAAAGLGIAVVAGMLVLYKYSLPLLNSGKLTNPHMINSLIRLYFAAGFSYYSFQSVSYLAEIAKGSIRAEKNPVFFALWLSFFPKLASGPIERPETGLSQIRSLHERPRFEPERVSEAFSWLVYGYFLKVFFADQLSGFAAMCFASPEARSAWMLILGALAYSAQLYADFAGYSAIAVGAAKLFGIDLARNFFSPYLSANITEFWQRWHISLSSWLRDYVYIPLGGNRRGLARQCVNIVIVFLVSGFWHGSGWTFIVWGAIHAALSVAHTLWRRVLIPAVHRGSSAQAQTADKEPGPAGAVSRRAVRRAVCTALTFLTCAFAWIFFGSADLPSAADYIRCMLTSWAVPETYVILKSKLGVVLAGLAAVSAMDAAAYVKNAQVPELLAKCPMAVRYGFWLLAAVLIFVFGAYGTGYNAGNFIYSQF